LGGVAQLDTAELDDLDLRHLNALKQRIESREFGFLLGEPELWPRQTEKIAALLKDIKELKRVARRTGREFLVEIRAYADSVGDEELTLSASDALARRFFDALERQHLDMDLFTTRGMGVAGSPIKDAAAGRKYDARVTLWVELLN
jgi:outer membrane protein OmpA-like peptidoglycan-associated protein